MLVHFDHQSRIKQQGHQQTVTYILTQLCLEYSLSRAGIPCTFNGTRLDCSVQLIISKKKKQQQKEEVVEVVVIIQPAEEEEEEEEGGGEREEGGGGINMKAVEILSKNNEAVAGRCPCGLHFVFCLCVRLQNQKERKKNKTDKKLTRKKKRSQKKKKKNSKKKHKTKQK